MDGWSRVIAAVVDRRAELGWTQKELASAAGVSERTVQNLEAGVRPQARNRHKIEQALGWKSGEMRRLEEGEVADRSPPTILDERLGREDADVIRNLLYDMEPDRADAIIAGLEDKFRRRASGTG